MLRYWLRLPEMRYLTRASAEVFLVSKGEAVLGTDETVFSFRWSSPRDSVLPIDEYAAIRGVRYVKIPLWARSRFNPKTSLLAALSSFLTASEPMKLEIVISGVGPDWRMYQKSRQYKPRELLVGYDFVSIRRDEVEKRVKAPMPKSAALRFLEYDRAYVLFHEHLNCVHAQTLNPECSWLYRGAKTTPERRAAELHLKAIRDNGSQPLKVHELEEGQVINRTFRVRQCIERFRKKGCSGANRKPKAYEEVPVK